MLWDCGRVAETGDPGRPLRALAAGYLAALLIALAVHGPHPLRWLTQISFPTSDPSALPYGGTTRPVWGVHHFGDWQLWLAWARDPNPYLIDDFGMHGLPPVLWAVRLIDGLTALGSWAILAGLSVGLTAAATWLLMAGRPWWQRALTWVAVFGLSAGLLGSLDRGSTQGVAVGLVGLWLWAEHSDRPYLSAAFMALAVFVKPYMIVLLLWPVLRGRWRSVLPVVGIVAIGALAGFAALPGPVLDSVLGWRHASSLYLDPVWGAPMFKRTNGMFGLLAHPPLLLTNDPSTARSVLGAYPGAVIAAPGLLWLALVSWVTWRRTVSEPLVVCLVLSLSQLMLPSSQAYTASFAGLGAVVLMTSPPGATSERPARLAVWVALLLTIVPIPLAFGGVPPALPVPLASFVTPLAWLVAGVVCTRHMPVADHRPRTKLDDEALFCWPAL